MENKPKVIYELYVLPHYTVPLLEELAKHVDLLVVVDKGTTIDGLKKVASSPHFKTIELDRNSGRGLFHPDIFRIIEEFKPDVFLSFLGSLERMLNNRVLYKRLKSMNIKIMAAGCDGYNSRHQFPAILKMLINQRMNKWDTIKSTIAYSRIDKFLMYSTRSAQYLTRQFLVSARKIIVTGNTIDTSVLNRTYNTIRSSGKSALPYKIIYCGRLTPSKRPAILIEAFNQVVTQFPEATMDIVGEGSETANLTKLTRDLGLEEKIKFWGGVYDDEKVATLMASASLYVMPALGGLGLNTAMACGLPVVYTDSDGTERDMLLSRNLGWYFNGSTDDLARKIIEAFNNPQKMVRDGKIGEELITSDYTIKKMAEIYKKAIN